MLEHGEKNIHQELVVAILKSGSAFTVPGGILGETEQDYLTRLAVAVSHLSDESWSLIPEWAQAWYDAAAKTMNGWYDGDGNQLPNRVPLPACPGMPGQAFILADTPPIPKTAQDATGIAPEEPLRLPQEQRSACLMAESTPEAGKDGLMAPAEPIQQAEAALPPAKAPVQPAPPRMPILDALHVIMAEHLSGSSFCDVTSEPSPNALREELVRRGYRKLSVKLIREERKSFSRTVEALRDAGKMK